VQAAGAEAICVTVDSPLDGARYRQQRLPMALPPGVTYPHLAGSREPSSIQTLDTVIPANLTWKDVEWLRSICRVPLLLKGVMSGEDAAQGIGSGADGIMVSNHGGRCLDTLPSTIEVLPEVVAAVAGKVPVIVDGGVRRGTDIVKALALGAAAVQIGRPYVYGLAIGGAAGVEHVIRILRKELLMAMCLLGCAKISDIDHRVLWDRKA
jgi:4-hydroxymandelate oxidase